MALSPNDGDTFLKEVDDELRREQVSNFITRYGWWLLAAAVLLLAGVGAGLWWRSHQAALAEAQGEALIDALGKVEAGNRAAATPKIAELAQSDIEGYRAAALFARANSESAAGNAPAAIATLRAIAADQGLDQNYRDAALVRQTALEFDTLPPQQVVQRLRPLAVVGNPWHGSAGEMLAVAYMKMGRRNLAAPVFATIARDENVPDEIRGRAGQMASSLGIDTGIGPGGSASRDAPASAAQPAPPPAPAAAAATKE